MIKRGDLILVRPGRVFRAVSAVLLLCLGGFANEEESANSAARRILNATSVKGGLVVHYGSGRGRLTAALHAGDSYLVHGLDNNPSEVEEARKYIRSLGIYGKVSVELWKSADLPYRDNLVNLFVAEGPGKISIKEVIRILAPKGVAYIKKGGEWKKTVKPFPEEMDQWTHYLHDASNNAVSHDKAVGPPRRLQWVGSPRWARHHDRMASLNALVSANGRLFYIFDEGPTAAVMLPPEWALIARDAFNGAVLWKRKLSSWHPHLWPMKSGYAQLPRRLIAVEDRVYVTLGLEAPLSCLNAATGEIVRTYEHTQSTEEVIHSGGVLFCLVNESPLIHKDFKPEYKRTMWSAMRRAAHGWPWDGKPRWIVALKADTGEMLWKRRRRVVPLTLGANRKGLFFHNGEKLVCLKRESGSEVWSSKTTGIHFPKEEFTGSGRRGAEVWKPSDLDHAFVPTCFAPTLAVQGEVVLFAGGDKHITALSARTGETLWTGGHHPSGHFSPQDLFVVNGLVWSGAIALPQRFHSGEFRGRDLYTGEVKERIPCDTDVFFMHQRCYRSKATDRYLIPSRTGTEFIGYQEKHWIINHWVRGGCLYGTLPCNGLLYAPPHSCACYMMAKLNGFNALAPEPEMGPEAGKTDKKNRLVTGPAYDSKVKGPSPGENDWPTYRHDGKRSGCTKEPVPYRLKRVWQSEPGGRLSSCVIAGGKVFVAQIDQHALYAMDADGGKVVWSFTAGGRIDSPPTIYKSRVYFGCADGWVYCLSSTDGQMVWKFRAAPHDERVVAFEQVESPWPVHGSVLIQDGVLYCVAGRCMFLDGGMRLFRLDPETGRKLSETFLNELDPETGKSLQIHIKGHNMPVALPDILSGDGEHIYMRTQRFDSRGHREAIPPLSANNVKEAAVQDGEGVHLFSPIGFLDGSWWHRGYWVYGKRFATGAGGYPQAGKFAPAGRILVYDESGVYGYGRKPEYFRWTTPLEYRLFAAKRELKHVKIPFGRRRRGGERPRIPATRPVMRWSRTTRLQVRGLVLAAKRLFLSGPPDMVDEEKAFLAIDDTRLQKRLKDQSVALEGGKGALLKVVSVSDGSELAAYKLKSPPVWDGMAAANGRLYVCTLQGKVLCLGETGQDIPEAPITGE